MTYDRYIGVDGCRGGWFAVSIDPDGDAQWDVFRSFIELWDVWGERALILIDIPIGLPSPRTPSRQCDTDARRMLSPHRHTSVFSPPCRDAIQATDYADACRRNQDSIGRKITLQTWHILPKIREIDTFLNDHIDARGAVRECHPEVCFQSLGGGAPMVHPKKSNKGYQERLHLLNAHFPQNRAIVKQAMTLYPQRVLKPDDVIDALVTAVTAYVSRGRLSTLPRRPPQDARGLPMEMVYVEP